VKYFRGIVCLLLLTLASVTLQAATWFVRSDGGTRFSSKVSKGQCDGTADAPYPGTGTNQHCAFSDVRYLWTDGSYTASTAPSAFPSYGWIGTGGDTYLIHGGPWRVGQSGPNPKDGFGLYGNPYDAGAPAPPSGTATQHTRILGEHFASCSADNKTQLFGGYGVGAVLNLTSSFLDVQCLELTRHSQCIRIGVPAHPGNCHTGFPLDDYASSGIVTDQSTHDLTLRDLWIHGFPLRGIIGPIGGTVTAQHVDIAYNGGAGWDFDDGKATPSINAVLNMDDVTIEWSGCNQAYPGSGAISCYSQSTSGYGDGIGTPAKTCITSHIDRSTFRYNTQDGFDMLHNDTGNCSLSITNSTAYGNNGAQFKWGANDNPAVFRNNTVLGNCRRMSAFMADQPPSYNRNLSDFCRAQDAMAFNLQPGGTVTLTNNTIVNYSPTTLDIDCSGDDCSTSTLTFRNNIVMGYDNPATYGDGGESGGPGGFYFGHPIGHIVRSGNLFSGLRGHSCTNLQPGERCADPKFVNQPTFTKEADLDHFNFHLSPASPSPKAGARLP
jgi:hypothetical protein